MDKIYSFYHKKKVLITGHTGFKGSWLTYWLLLMGAEVIGFSDRIPTNPSLFELLKLQNNITHIVGDVRDQDLVIKTIQQAKPDICFHLAAQPLVRLSYKDPILTYTTNMIGSLNILESIRLTKLIKTIVMITSDKCYENKEWDYGYRESDQLGGHDPYSSSKACAELIINAYRTSYLNQEGIGCASVRAGNVIGGGDWSQDRLIVDCILALSVGKEIVIRFPKSTRPWQHVLEPLSGYLTVGKLLDENPEQYSEAWNFGPIENKSITVEDIVQKMIALWGKGTYRINPENASKEAGKLQLDIHKSTSLLNWYPRWNAEKAIEETIVWYKTFYQQPTTDFRSLCEKQINSYLYQTRK
jgi:CDP-glucose 4,6-dehydratase